MKIIYKIILPVTIMMFFAVLTVSFIGYTNISKEIHQVMKVSLQGPLEDIIKEREAVKITTATLKKSLNNNFLRIARTAALAITDSRFSIDEIDFSAMAREMGMEEIHIVNKEGILINGNIPGFYGFDFHTSDQTIPFLKILEDSHYELAQEPQRRGADDVLFQYIGVHLPVIEGILQVGVKPQELQILLDASSLQKTISDYNYKDGGYAYILDPVTETCTHHVNTDLIGYDMSTLSFAQQIFERKNGCFTYIWEDVEIFTCFEKTDVGIIVTASPTAPYLESLKPILRALIISSLCSLLILIGFTALMVRRIIAPLHRVNDSLKEIASGRADLTKRIKVSSRDEIGEVAGNFNLFMEKLQELITDIQEAVKQTGRIRNSIIESTGITAGSVDEINENINQVESRLKMMDDKITDNASAMVEINSNTDSFDSMISTQAAMVEESTAAITEMIASLNNVGSITKTKQRSTTALRDVAEEGKNQIDLTSNEFSLVEEKVSNIKEMANTINSIAAQTNLLSMNAAIEAAHAGDSGRGFAVVADEIRKLAETSGRSSGNITRIIAEITEGIKKTSENMGSTLTTFDTIAQEVDSTVNAFMEIESSVSELTIGGQQIMSSTDEINNVTAQVRSGSSEISKGIETSNEALHVIKENSTDITDGVTQIFTNASDVSRSMKELQNTTGELDIITNDLSMKFDQFITEKEE